MAVREQRKKRHLFVVNSTLTPGTSDDVLKPLLEQALEGECGKVSACVTTLSLLPLGTLSMDCCSLILYRLASRTPCPVNCCHSLQTLNTNSPPIERMSISRGTGQIFSIAQ